MLPPIRSHEEYIEFVDENLKNVSIPEAHKDVVVKLKLLDLTSLRLLFLPLYCLTFGRIGFAPPKLLYQFDSRLYNHLPTFFVRYRPWARLNFIASLLI